MEATIKIKTNRIYFEQFEAPCGEPEVTEIKQAWESAIYAVIEASGFQAETHIGVGFDPAVQKIVVTDFSGECDCEKLDKDCECGYKPELQAFAELCEKYGNLIAEKAVEAGSDAARAKSDEFVKASEAHKED